MVQVQAVHDKVMENSALLKELWEGRRQYKEVQLSLQREREQAKAVQLEYAHFRHQVTLHAYMTALTLGTHTQYSHSTLVCTICAQHSAFTLNTQARTQNLTFNTHTQGSAFERCDLQGLLLCWPESLGGQVAG